MWSFRALDRNISTQYYERRLAAQREKSALPVDMENSTDPLEYIKNPMMAEFMGFHRDADYNESDFEKALIAAKIDSDSTINGQIKRTDAEDVKVLSIPNLQIKSLRLWR